MKKKICKFERLIGANTDSIRSNRSSLITTQTKNSLTRYISAVENEITTKELELDRLLDLAPDTTDSLRPGGKDFNPDQFIERCLLLRNEIKVLKEIDLKNAQDFMEEMFIEETQEG